MKLTPEQIDMLQQAVNLEIKTQMTLARAREAAAEIIEEHFVMSDDAPQHEPEVIKVATQFVARPFRPLTQLLRGAIQATQQADVLLNALNTPQRC